MEEIKRFRREQVLALMRRENLDGLLVSNCALGNLNTWLLAGEEMPLHLPYNRNNLCMVDGEGAVRQFCAREPHPTDWGKFPVITEQPPADVFRGSRLGLVNPTYLKKCVRDYFCSAYPELVLVDVSEAFHRQKAEKCPAEVEGLRAAEQQFDTAFRTIPLLLTGEPLEREAAVRLRNRLRELGAECEDLQSSAMLTLTSARDGGVSEPEPVPYPGRRIGYGDRVNVQLNGFMPGGFAAALGRCYVLGEPSAETRRCWRLAVEAQELAASRAKPGATVEELMEHIRREILEPNGLAEAPGLQIYGIGAGIQECPRNIDVSRSQMLREHMTLVIAPKISLPGKDPYCCMDVFAVTPNGGTRLGTLPRDLVCLD